MLLDKDRERLQVLMQQKLGDTENMLVVSGTLVDSSRGRPEGLFALGASVIAFAAQDVLSGEIWKQWPRSEVGPIQLDEDFMGGKLSFTFGGDTVAVERIPKESVASLKERIQGQGQSQGQVQVNGRGIGIGAGGAEMDPLFEHEPTPVNAGSQRTASAGVPAGANAAANAAVSESWICSGCGKKNTAGFKFCAECGDEAPPPGQSGGSRSGPVGGPVEPRLVGLGKHAGEVHPLTGEVCKVGRVQNAHVTIPSGRLSRLHAVIEGTGSTRTIIDLGSSNGTFVNGKRIDKATIKHGDRIGFSDEHEFIFETMGSASSSVASSAASYGAQPPGSPQTGYGNQGMPGNQGYPRTGGGSVKLVLIMAIGITVLGVVMMLVILAGQ